MHQRQNMTLPASLSWMNLPHRLTRLQNPDSFGHQYTAYVNKLVETREPCNSPGTLSPKENTQSTKTGPGNR